MNWVHRRNARLPVITITLIFMAVIAVLCNVTTAKAQVGSPSAPGLISLDVVDADLSQVVRILMSETKQSIVIGDPSVRDKKVTAMLNNIPLETALKYIVESVGCSWYQQPDGVYIIGEKRDTEATAQKSNEPEIAWGQTSAMHTTPNEYHQARRSSKVDSIRLYNTTPADIMWILGLYSLDQAPKIDASHKKPGVSPVMIQNMDGSVEPVIVPGDNRSVFPDEFTRNNMDYAPRSPSILDEAAQAGYPGYPTRTTPTRTTAQQRQPGQPGAIPGQPGQAGQPGQQAAAGLLPEGIDYIMPYELDNSLIVRGDEEGIEELKAIISKLDVAPRQIHIEAKFVSIATTDLESLGINWTLERLNMSAATQFAPAGNVLIGYAAGDLMANLKTQMSKSHGKLINAPIITTMNNVPASIGFSTVIPYLDSVAVTGTAGITTQSVTRFLPVQSQLWVLPRINSADDSITVTIMPTISDVEKFVDTAEGSLPIVNSQFLRTIRRVNNGETIVLGGLIRKDDHTRVDKIPLLGDLPLIGPLFRSTQKSTDDKELLIFLTPTIVPERPIAGAGIGVIP